MLLLNRQYFFSRHLFSRHLFSRHLYMASFDSSVSDFKSYVKNILDEKVLSVGEKPIAVVLSEDEKKISFMERLKETLERGILDHYGDKYEGIEVPFKGTIPDGIEVELEKIEDFFVCVEDDKIYLEWKNEGDPIEEVIYGEEGSEFENKVVEIKTLRKFKKIPLFD